MDQDLRQPAAMSILWQCRGLKYTQNDADCKEREGGFPATCICLPAIITNGPPVFIPYRVFYQKRRFRYGCSMCLMWLRVTRCGRWRKSSPLQMICASISLTDRQRNEFQKKYKNGSIFAKMNSLEDAQIIHKLYEPQMREWKFRLLVARDLLPDPGVEGSSENNRGQEYCGQILRTLAYLRF